jgi:hypothetical protein
MAFTSCHAGFNRLFDFFEKNVFFQKPLISMLGNTVRKPHSIQYLSLISRQIKKSYESAKTRASGRTRCRP